MSSPRFQIAQMGSPPQTPLAGGAASRLHEQHQFSEAFSSSQTPAHPISGSQTRELQTEDVAQILWDLFHQSPPSLTGGYSSKTLFKAPSSTPPAPPILTPDDNGHDHDQKAESRTPSPPFTPQPTPVKNKRAGGASSQTHPKRRVRIEPTLIANIVLKWKNTGMLKFDTEDLIDLQNLTNVPGGLVSLIDLMRGSKAELRNLTRIPLRSKEDVHSKVNALPDSDCYLESKEPVLISSTYEMLLKDSFIFFQYKGPSGNIYLLYSDPIDEGGPETLKSTAQDNGLNLFPIDFLQTSSGGSPINKAKDLLDCAEVSKTLSESSQTGSGFTRGLFNAYFDTNGTE